MSPISAPALERLDSSFPFFSRDFVTAEVLACEKSFSLRVACLTLNDVSICVVFDNQLTLKEHFVACCHKPLRCKLPDRCLTKQLARCIAYANSNLFCKSVNAIVNLFLNLLFADRLYGLAGQRVQLHNRPERKEVKNF